LKKTIVVDVLIAQLPNTAQPKPGFGGAGLADRSSRWRSETGAASIVAQGIGPMSGPAFALIAR
jgi:hypothetical protein